MRTFVHEMHRIVHDEGVVLFFIVVPILYPLLYSWIYNNETVRGVDVTVVDMSKTGSSRQFVRMLNASPDINVSFHCNSLEEARHLVGKQLSHGTIYIPADFDTRLNNGEQTVVSVFSDMAFLLNYKAIYKTCIEVSGRMNALIQVERAGKYTSRDEELLTRPLEYEDVSLFNPTGGYGSFIIPGALVLILQQTLLLGIGLMAGTDREKRRLVSAARQRAVWGEVMTNVTGKASCCLVIYSLLLPYVLLIVPRIFHFPSIGNPVDILQIAIPFLLAVIFFGMTLSPLVRYRENIILLVVFTSVPFLFMSGVSWPKSDIPGFWQGLSWLIPSTFGIQSYMRINSMGATIADVRVEQLALWTQAIAYFLTACLVHRARAMAELRTQRAASSPRSATNDQRNER